MTDARLTTFDAIFAAGGRRAAALCMALVLAGCTQVTDNELRPGQYDIALAGEAAGLEMPGLGVPAAPVPAKVCISGDPADYAAQLMKPFMALNSECAGAVYERSGPKITGTAQCSLDQARAPGGKVLMMLKGEIGAGGMTAEIGTRWSLGAGADPQLVHAARQMEQATLRVSATYTGVCDEVVEAPRRKPSKALPARDETVAEDTAASDTSVEAEAPEDVLQTGADETADPAAE